MADDVTLPGLGDKIATDYDGTRHYQWMKVVWGGDDIFNKVDTATGKPLPMQVRTATGAIVLGEPTDAKSAATDATSASMISLLKQLSAYLRDGLDGDYETVIASQTDQSLGATGAAGDFLSSVLIVPASTSPGAVSIKDGSGSGITIFTGGTGSVPSLVPFVIGLGMKSLTGAWKITTGASVSAIGIGNFT